MLRRGPVLIHQVTKELGCLLLVRVARVVPQCLQSLFPFFRAQRTFCKQYVWNLARCHVTMKCSTATPCRSCPSCLPDVTGQRQAQSCPPDLQRSALSGPFAAHAHGRFRASLSAPTDTATAKRLTLDPKSQDLCPLASISRSALLLSCMERCQRSLPVMNRSPIAPSKQLSACMVPTPTFGFESCHFQYGHANMGCNRTSTLLGFGALTGIGQTMIGGPVRAFRGHAGRFRPFRCRWIQPCRICSAVVSAADLPNSTKLTPES